MYRCYLQSIVVGVCAPGLVPDDLFSKYAVENPIGVVPKPHIIVVYDGMLRCPTLGKHL